MIPVVGLCGYAGVGKTTAASCLWPMGYQRERFAGPLKGMLRALGLSEAEVDGDLKEAPCSLLGGATPRWAMQSLGTSWGRELIHPELWLMAWERRADALLRAGGKVVCDDIRFPNEAEAVRERGGIVIRVSSDKIRQSSSHISEALGFSWDAEVRNDGSIAALSDNLSHVITRQYAANTLVDKFGVAA